jgi:AcrR family transcriptional regulator
VKEGRVTAERAQPTRERIASEAMRLFGEQGYGATTVAEIEAAAGLSPGSGSLYRHYPSKQALLAAAVQEQLSAGQQLIDFIDDPASFAALPWREQLVTMARAGLRALDQQRDLNRLLVKDLRRFPELLAAMGEGEMARIYRAVGRWLAERAGPGSAERDWDAIAVVLTGAVAHYWLLRDVFGRHPSELAEERFLTAFAEAAAGLLDTDDRTEE